MTILADSRTKTNRKGRKTNGTSKLTVSLALAIDHQAYSVTPIRAEDPDITRAWRLEKRGADGAVYDVATTIHGHQCDCPDWETRRNGLDPEGCKHVRACVQMGLLDAAPVIPAAPTVKPAPVADFYARDQACLQAFLAESGVDPEPAPVRCSGCHRDSIREEGGLPYCGMCFDRMIHTPVAPAPCCPPDEPTACQPCQATAPATDAATAILDRGIALAEAEVNQSIALPDHFEDEAPELDDYEPTDDDRYAVAEAFTAADVQSHLDRSGTLPLPEAIDHIAVTFKGWNTPFGSMLAHVLEELAQKAFMTGAATPAELLTGIESLDREARETWERIGRESVAKPVVNIDDPAARRGKPSAGCAHGNVMPAVYSRY